MSELTFHGIFLGCQTLKKSLFSIEYRHFRIKVQPNFRKLRNKLRKMKIGNHEYYFIRKNTQFLYIGYIISVFIQPKFLKLNH